MKSPAGWFDIPAEQPSDVADMPTTDPDPSGSVDIEVERPTGTRAVHFGVARPAAAPSPWAPKPDAAGPTVDLDPGETYRVIPFYNEARARSGSIKVF